MAVYSSLTLSLSLCACVCVLVFLSKSEIQRKLRCLVQRKRMSFWYIMFCKRIVQLFKTPPPFSQEKGRNCVYSKQFNQAYEEACNLLSLRASKQIEGKAIEQFRKMVERRPKDFVCSLCRRDTHMHVHTHADTHTCRYTHASLDTSEVTTVTRTSSSTLQ